MPLYGETNTFVNTIPVAAVGAIQTTIRTNIEVEGVTVAKVFADVYAGRFTDPKAY